jgi:Holliday junction resolvase
LTTNYRRGADFERRVRADLTSRGYVAIRAAGSHGVADILAMKRFDTPLMVQVKKDGRLGPKERCALVAEAKRAGATPIMAAHVLGQGIRYTIVSVMDAAGTVLHVDEKEKP